MTDYKKLAEIHAEKLKKAIQHLKYSFNNIQTLGTDVHKLNESQLAEWESFEARFSRASDIYFMKYLRVKTLIHDPGFRGSFIDLLLRVPMEILSSAKKIRIPFSLEIQKHLGEQKIDVLIIDINPPQDPFHQIAVEQAVLLRQW